MFLSFRIKYTIVIVSLLVLVVLVMHLGTFPPTRLCPVYGGTPSMTMPDSANKILFFQINFHIFCYLMINITYEPFTI